jgi:hypothetical protein
MRETVLRYALSHAGTALGAERRKVVEIRP